MGERSSRSPGSGASGSGRPSEASGGLRPVASDSRVLPAIATIDRIEPRRSGDWTGEFRSHSQETWLSEESPSSKRAMPGGPRGANELKEDAAPTQNQQRSRGALELRLRLVAVVTLALLLLVVGFDASRLLYLRVQGAGQAWREVPLRLSSEPSGAQVFIDDKAQGVTPMVTHQMCRGRVIRVRIASPGHSNWTWHGLCPERGSLVLKALLKAQEKGGG